MFKRMVLTLITFSMILTLFSGCNTIVRTAGNADATIGISKTTGSSTADIKTQPVNSSKGFTRGKWDNGVYTNDLVGFKFSLPQGWKVSSDDAIAEVLGISNDVFKDNQKWLIESAKMNTIYDMMAKNIENGDNIAVMFENLLLTAGTSDVSEEEYTEAVEKSMVQNTKLDYEFGEPYKTTIASDEYLTIRCDEKNSGSTQYILMRNLDKYMLCMILTINDKTKIDDILAQFEPK